MLRFREALIAGMVTKQNKEKNLPRTSCSSISVAGRNSKKNIGYRNMNVQPEQTENDALPATEKFKRMKELEMLEKSKTCNDILQTDALYSHQDLVLLELKNHRSISPILIHMQFTEIF